MKQLTYLTQCRESTRFFPVVRRNCHILHKYLYYFFSRCASLHHLIAVTRKHLLMRIFMILTYVHVWFLLDLSYRAYRKRSENLIFERNCSCLSMAKLLQRKINETIKSIGWRGNAYFPHTKCVVNLNQTCKNTLLAA